MSGWDRRITAAGRLGLVVVVLAAVSSCGDAPPEGDVQIEIPEGASAGAIGRILRDEGLIGSPGLFRVAVRLRGSGGSLKAGTYRIPGEAGYFQILDVLEAGAVETVPFTIPEGFDAEQIAAVVAEVTAAPVDSVVALVTDSAFAAALGVPGPTLEGYLFPETYRVAEGLPPRDVLRILVEGYHDYWNAERRALLDSTGLTERELVTLASIVEKEARVVAEMPTIAGVYANRLERGMLLQADPTVQYALGSPRARLLYADIDRVADNPYNTYTNPGLPPGPIASPGARALDAALEPAEHDFLFFVARDDGSHVFTRTNREHVNAKNRVRAEAAQAAAERAAVREDSVTAADSSSLERVGGAGD